MVFRFFQGSSFRAAHSFLSIAFLRMNIFFWMPHYLIHVLLPCMISVFKLYLVVIFLPWRVFVHCFLFLIWSNERGFLFLVIDAVVSLPRSLRFDRPNVPRSRRRQRHRQLLRRDVFSHSPAARRPLHLPPPRRILRICRNFLFAPQSLQQPLRQEMNRPRPLRHFLPILCHGRPLRKYQYLGHSMGTEIFVTQLGMGLARHSVEFHVGFDGVHFLGHLDVIGGEGQACPAVGIVEFHHFGVGGSGEFVAMEAVF
mmetsp:Transcript_11694/g.24264  ORF Transcript_11694/g.24264 Transcript_11694/m.24264 type:complete len:255 (-) Transcript_11694:155-919(-)